MVVTSLLAAYTGLYSTYGGHESAGGAFFHAASKEFGPHGISVTTIGADSMGTSFFYGRWLVDYWVGDFCERQLHGPLMQTTHVGFGRGAYRVQPWWFTVGESDCLSTSRMDGGLRDGWQGA